MGGEAGQAAWAGSQRERAVAGAAAAATAAAAMAGAAAAATAAAAMAGAAAAVAAAVAAAAQQRQGRDSRLLPAPSGPRVMGQLRFSALAGGSQQERATAGKPQA